VRSALPTTPRSTFYPGKLVASREFSVYDKLCNNTYEPPNKPSYFSLYTGWLIGILIMVY